MFNRNYRTPSKLRNSNFGTKWSHVTPSRARGRALKYPVSRRLSYERIERPLSTNTIVEVQHGSHMSLQKNTDIASFVQYPVRGINGDGRSRDYIKLLKLDVSGVINVKTTSIDHTMDPSDKLSGLFVLTILLDRKPYLPEGVNTLPGFSELFGPYASAYANMHLLDSQKNRFKVLGIVKKFVGCASGAIYAPINKCIPLSKRKYPLWATFKDPDQGNCGGNYKNISKNAIVMSYAFISLHSLSVEPYVQFELKYLG
ncbi:BV1 protein [Horsegram yellow mosaic virus]|uniref:Nuclear shuttle protein n=1 Tax=Horsegram yellow mosaic virus TaxID=263793 RepID=Q701P6_9GEMI|nr:BV1 protein [Horsegram yellow mosaic virus]CAF29515.1 BV1 protein [Horsegram yellow mosaic virus]